MEEADTSRLARLKESLLQASDQASSSDGFAALQKSLNAVLDAHSRVQRGHGAALSALRQEKVEQFNETVSKARKQLQTKCEQLQVRHFTVTQCLHKIVRGTSPVQVYWPTLHTPLFTSAFFRAIPHAVE